MNDALVGSRNPAVTEPLAVSNRQSSPRAAKDFARAIPYWFLAIVGLIYAAGFLIVVTHLGTFGIRDVGGEVWKARDIHIGVLGFVFPITIMGTMAIVVLDPLIHLARSQKGVRDFMVRAISFQQLKNWAANVPSSRQSRNLAPNGGGLYRQGCDVQIRPWEAALYGSWISARRCA